MKTISSIIKFTGSIGLMVGITMLSTVPTFAMNTATTSAACTRIATLGDMTSATIAGHIATMNDDFTTRLTNIANRSTTIDPKIDTARTKSTAAFDAKITSLESPANLTTAQKAAIQAYSASMHTAETTREAAIDAARTTYRTDLLTTVKAHQTALTTATTTYQTSVAAAFTTAGVNCGDGTATATLKTSVKSAKDTFKTARTDAKVTTDIKALMTTRNTAIAAADATFTKDAAAYTATLSAILSTTTSTTNS
jgi:hypothetical protein